MDTQQLREFIAVTRERNMLREHLREVEERLRKLETDLLSQFADAEIANIKCDGVTVYLRSQLWATAKNGDQAALNTALRKAGFGDLIEERVLPSRLSALVREFDEREEELPETLAQAIDVVERFSLRVLGA